MSWKVLLNRFQENLQLLFREKIYILLLVPSLEYLPDSVGGVRLDRLVVHSFVENARDNVSHVGHGTPGAAISRYSKGCKTPSLWQVSQV